MTLTRRAFAAASAASLAMPAFAASNRPIVIAHRGASGERPEHTRSAYMLAIEQGCDFIEPDLVVSKDGHLVVRHENEIGGTTDIARRPEFAARKTRKVIDGESLEGWFAEDFTLAELKTLRARERLPQLRPVSAAHDGADPILTFAEVAEIAAKATAATGRTIGVYPEMKHPTFLAAQGLAPEARLADAVKAAGLDSATAPIFVQCFEVGALKTFGTLSKARRVFLVDAEGGPADQPGRTYAEYLTPAGLKTVAGFAEGLGPNWRLVVPVRDGALAPASPLVADAHAAGLKVHPWTVRAENAFLPDSLKRGSDPAAHGDVDAVFAALWKAGVDGLFSDFPGLAAKSRG